MDNDRNGNGGGFSPDPLIPHPRLPSPGGLTNSVAPDLCASYRAHLETKIGDMETNIKNSVYIAGFIIVCVQLAIQFFG